MGETILVKVGRKLILFLGVVLALFAGFLSLRSLGGFMPENGLSQRRFR